MILCRKFRTPSDKNFLIEAEKKSRDSFDFLRKILMSRMREEYFYLNYKLMLTKSKKSD
jgi:hypothetical protein